MSAYDLFAGAGGFTQGLAAAGISVTRAFNHWEPACVSWNANHANHGAQVVFADLQHVDPAMYPGVDVLAASPECTTHSYAGAPQATRPVLALPQGQRIAASIRSRATMRNVMDWVELHSLNRFEDGLKAVIVENVQAVVGWAPWDLWRTELALHGYRHRVLSLNSRFFNVPTNRDRLFVVAWHETVDDPDLRFEPPAWCASCRKGVQARQHFFDPKRIAGAYRPRKGVSFGQYEYRCPACGTRVEPAHTPADQAVDLSLAPGMSLATRARSARAAGGGRLSPSTLARIDAGRARHGDVPLLVKMTNTSASLDTLRHPGSPLHLPFPTVTCQAEWGLYQPGGGGSFRTLTPAELTCAMGFPASYQLAGSKRTQTKLIGNAVCPPVAAWLGSRVAAVVS